MHKAGDNSACSLSALHNDIMVVSVTSRCSYDYVIFSKQHGRTVAEREARSRNPADGHYAEVGCYNTILSDREVLAHLSELELVRNLVADSDAWEGK